MYRSITMTTMLSLLAVGACKKSEDKETATAKVPEPTKAEAKAAADDPVGSVGVTAGGVQRDAADGPAAVVTAATGTVEVRRLGETTYSAATADTKLWQGDAVRTGEASTTTIALADESVMEVAEVSTVAIASREGSADPASSAAVLSGLARFTVTPRTPGEGAFRVYTPAGVVITRGTVYGVGVAASGDVRVGVESGAVDVFGLAALDAKPIAIEGGAFTTLEASGSVGTPAPWPADDWGTWRDGADANIEISASIDAHAKAMAELNTSLLAAYADLDSAASSVATFEASASASAAKADTATYEASLPDGAAMIDVSFSLAGRIEALTWANAGYASLTTDLYIRHPDVVGPTWTVVAPRVDAAVLWPKRFEVTAVGYLEPLRMQYYVHHPRGRAHATFVGVAVPEFYASVQPPVIEPANVRGRFKSRFWIAPELQYTASTSTRSVWIAAPSLTWRAKLDVRPAAFRANTAWYVRPPTLKSKVLLGGDIKGKWNSKLAIATPSPRANLRASWKVPVGMKIKVGAPDLNAAANARAKFKIGGPGVQVDHRANVKGRVDGKVDVRVPQVKLPDVKVGVGVKAAGDAKATADAKVKANADAKVKANAGIKVKAPDVKIKAPDVKVKGQVKGGIKLGN